MKYRVPDSDANKRIDIILTECPHIHSRNQAQKLITSGQVKVDGQYPKKNQRLFSGQVIEYQIPEVTELPEPQPLPIKVVFEDKHIIVVDKSAGMVVHPSAGHQKDTLVNALLAKTSLAETGAPDRPGIVHRLDKDTSGLIVVAKTNLSYQKLVEAIKKREINRFYLVLAEGRVETEIGRIEAPIARNPKNRQQMSVHLLKGKEAITNFTVLKRYSGYTLMQVCLETGRTHQIRVHLAYFGYPVFGDKTYGRKKQSNSGLPRLDRQFLHAWKLEFYHPVTSIPLKFVSRLPKDLSSVLKYLSTHTPENHDL